MAEKKKRILYIDALRGFCMILIIMNHCHFTFFSNEIGQLLVNTRVPFFFFLSGLFFKRYGCFKEFCVKKLNQLVVPYFFFSYIPFCLFTYFYTDRYADPLFYLTASIKPWNTPLWFLRALLFAHFFYYFIDKLEKKSAWLQVLMIAVMVIVTFELNIGFKKIRVSYSLLKECSFLFNNFFTAIIAMPFFFLAQQIKKRGWLEFNISWIWTIPFSSTAFVLAYFFRQKGFSFYGAYFGDHIILIYISPLLTVFALGLLFAKFKYTGFFQYIGRNSLIVLGCHALPVIILFENFRFPFYLVFLITLVYLMRGSYILDIDFPTFTAKEN